MGKVSRRDFIRNSAIGMGLCGCRLVGDLFAGSGVSKRGSKRPNIIVILTDDQRWNSLGCAGNSIIITPEMDRLARQGTRFANAFVTTPICAASRATVFTGLYERTHGYTFTKPPIAEEFVRVSYPYLLKRAGYRTGFVGKFGVKVEKEMLDDMFDEFRSTGFPYFKKVGGKERHLTDINMDRALEFIRGCGEDETFCLSLSFWAPHADDGRAEQYFWPKDCDTLYQNVKIPPAAASDPAFFESHPVFLRESMNRKRWYWRFDTPEKYQQMVKGHYRMISGIDRALGRLREELRRRKLDDKTVIILMGDNGYFLGERGYAGKWTMHEPSIRVPLIVYDPRLSLSRRGSVPEQPVLNLDLAPTILEMAGLKVPEKAEGRSLVPLIAGRKTSWRKVVFTEHLWEHPEIPVTEAVRTERWKYIRYPQHPEYEELYDLKHDFWEMNNLAKDARYQDTLIKMRKQCDEMIRRIRN